MMMTSIQPIKIDLLEVEKSLPPLTTTTTNLLQNRVWVQDGDEGFIEAVIMKHDTERDEVTVKFNDKTLKRLSTNLVQLINPPKYQFSNDLADLTYLNEVTINPYKQLPIYGEDQIQQYCNKKRSEVDPHIFHVADHAYRQLLNNKENQSILITGESGAGKTENTKKVIQYLTHIANSFNPEKIDIFSQSQPSQSHLHPFSAVVNSSTQPSSTYYSHSCVLEKQILSANPILEAFGNAKTIRNNNSSRFGKFIKLEFNEQGLIVGASIEKYLFEKSRVTHQSSKERNFHVFYQFLTGAPEQLKKNLFITGNPQDYRFLKDSQYFIESVNDVEDYKILIESMKTMKFSDEEMDGYFKIIAAILHLGNLDFKESRENKLDLMDKKTADSICKLLGIPLEDFIKCILHPKIWAGKEIVIQGRTKAQVLDSIETLARSLYERMFGALISRINQVISKPTIGISTMMKSHWIGILDIAGFEIFEKNSFEQLCINYTNEKLQQFFNHHMFILEQMEYKKEKIDWEFVDFGLDLQPTIDFIEKTNPIGVLALLDEDCVMPKATDETFTEKLCGIWKGKSNIYESNRIGFNNFYVYHYAGKVEYSTEGWLEKNKDPINNNVAELLAQSTDSFVSSLFTDSRVKYHPFDNTSEVSDKPAYLSRSKFGGGSFRTVSQKYKEQLCFLMNQLYLTQPHFVRCILPNEEKECSKFNSKLVLDQLKCNGVLEGIRICRLGFPNRIPFELFKQRYEILLSKNGMHREKVLESKVICTNILEELKDYIEYNSYRIGSTKVFFRAGILAQMENLRDAKMSQFINGLQCKIKSWIQKRQLYRKSIIMNSIKIIQKNAKIFIALKQWPWWRLWSRLKPLMNVTRVDIELRKKNKECSELKTKCDELLNSKAILETQICSLINENKILENEIFNEKGAIRDQNDLLERLRDKLECLETELDLKEKEKTGISNSLEKLGQEKYILEDQLNKLNSLLEGEIEKTAILKRDLDQKEELVQSNLLNMSSTLSKLEKDKEILSNQYEIIKGELLEKEKSFNDIEKDLKRVSVSYNQLEENLQTSAATNEILHSKLAEAENKVGHLDESFKIKTSELQHLQNFLAEKQSALSDLSLKYDEMCSENCSLKETHHSLNMQFIEIKPQVEQLLKNLDAERMKKEQKEQELIHLQQILNDKEGKIGEQQLEIRKMKEQEIESLNQELQKSKEAHLSELLLVRKELEKHKEKIIDLEGEKNQFLKTISQLEHLINQYKDNLKNESDLRTSAENKNMLLEKDIGVFKSLSMDNQKALAQKEKKIEQLQVACNELVQKYDNLQNSHYLKEKSLKDLEFTIMQLKSDLEFEKSSNQLYESSKKKLIDDMTNSNTALSEAKATIIDFHGRLKMTESEKELLLSEFEALQSEIQEMDTSSKKKDKEIIDINEQYINIKEIAENNDKLKKTYKIELEDTRLQVDRLTANNLNLERNYAHLSEKFKEMENVFNKYKLDNEKTQKEYLKACSKLREIEAEKTMMAQTFSETKTDLLNDMRGLNQSLEDGLETILKLEAEKQKLSNLVDDLRSSNNILISDKNRSEESSRLLQDKLKESTELLFQKEALISTFETQISTDKVKISQMKAKNEQSIALLNDAKKKHSHLLSEVEAKEKEVVELQGQYNSIKREFEFNRSLWKENNETVERLQAQYSELEEAYEQVKIEFEDSKLESLQAFSDKESEWKANISDLQQKMEHMMVELNDLKIFNNNLALESNKLRATVKDYELSLSNNEEEVAILNKEKAVSEKKMELLQQECKNSKYNLDTVNQQHSDMQFEYKQLMTIRNDLENNYSHLLNQFENYQVKVKELNETCRELSSKNMDLQKNSTLKEVKLHEFMDELEIEKQINLDKDQRLRSLEHAIQNLRKTLSEEQEKYYSVNAIRINLEQSIRNLQGKLSETSLQTETDYNGPIHSYNNIHCSPSTLSSSSYNTHEGLLLESTPNMKGSNSAANQRQWQGQLTEFQHHYKEVSKEKSELLRVKRTLEIRITSLTKAVEEKELRISSLEESYKNCRGLLDKSVRKCKELEENEFNLHGKCERLEKDLEEEKERLLKLNQELDKVNSQLGKKKSGVLKEYSLISKPAIDLSFPRTSLENPFMVSVSSLSLKEEPNIQHH